MRIAASSVFLNPDALEKAAKSLADGEAVFVSTSAQEANVVSAAPRSPELKGHIAAGRTAVAKVDQWNVPGLVIGSTGGTMVGAGVGVMLDQLRAVHPQSAAAFEAACALIGFGIGGMVGSKTIKLNVEAHGVKVNLE